MGFDEDLERKVNKAPASAVESMPCRRKAQDCPTERRLRLPLWPSALDMDVHEPAEMDVLRVLHVLRFGLFDEHSRIKLR